MSLPPLGFGTSSLAKNSTIRGAVRNLETAYGQGITHFDTAPAYCFGHAEMMLGKFLKGRRDQVTVSTKYGISPRRIPFVLLPVFNLVRKPLKQLLAKAVAISGSEHHHAFSYTTSIAPGALTSSLENSLRQLNTDYVDNFLLHQIDASLANQEDVVAELTKLRDAGKVRRLGLAGSYGRIYEEDTLRPFYTAIQFDDHAHKRHAERIDTTANERVYYRFGVFSQLGMARKFLAGESSSLSPVALCLAYYRQHPLGTTLFSSSNNKNIISVARQWEQLPGVDPALLEHFADHVRRHNPED